MRRQFSGRLLVMCAGTFSLAGRQGQQLQRQRLGGAVAWSSAIRLAEGVHLGRLRRGWM